MHVEEIHGRLTRLERMLGILTFGDALAEDSLAVTEARDQPQTLRDHMQENVLMMILMELRIMNVQLAQGFNLHDDLRSMRNDPSIFN